MGEKNSKMEKNENEETLDHLSRPDPLKHNEYLLQPKSFAYGEYDRSEIPDISYEIFINP